MLSQVLPGMFLVWMSPWEPACRHLRGHQEANDGGPGPLLEAGHQPTGSDGTWEHPEWGEFM